MSFCASLVAQMLKHLTAMGETWVLSLGQEDSLEEMATHSSTLAWNIPRTEEPGRLQPMGLQRVRHDWATSFHFLLMSLGKGLSIFLIFRRPNFSFIGLFYCSFISSLIFMISFLLLTLGFACSSLSSSFRCKVRLRFFLFPEVSLYHYKL